MDIRSPLPEALKEILINKRIVFTVTTGRSGTGYLASQLAYLPNIDCFHEPVPVFAEVMREAQRRPEAAHEFIAQKKLPFIASQKSLFYIETSHLFCKGFFEPLLALNVHPSLIFLKREHRQVALSLYRLDTIPVRTKKGEKYLLNPNDPGVLPIKNWHTLSDYQLCYWYCLEIERRSKEYFQTARDKNLCTVSITFDCLISKSGIRTIIDDLKLPAPSRLERFRMMMARSNMKNSKKVTKKSKMIADIDDQEKEVLERLETIQTFE
jgi:hypothetical protein